MDVSIVEAAIETLKGDVTTIGSAMFLVILVVVAFKYFRRSAS